MAIIILVLIIPFRAENAVGDFRKSRKLSITIREMITNLKMWEVPLSIVSQKRFPLKPNSIQSNSLLEEFLLDSSFVFGPAPSHQEFCDVSFDSTNYFVVWHDQRNEDNIYGARITPERILLDTFGISICTTVATLQFYPSPIPTINENRFANKKNKGEFKIYSNLIRNNIIVDFLLTKESEVKLEL